MSAVKPAEVPANQVWLVAEPPGPQIRICTRDGEGRRVWQPVVAEMVGAHCAIVDLPNTLNTLAIPRPPEWVYLFHVPTGLRVPNVELDTLGRTVVDIDRARQAMRRFGQWMHRVHPDLATTVLPTQTAAGPALVAWQDIEREAFAWTPSWTAPDQQTAAEEADR